MNEINIKNTSTSDSIANTALIEGALSMYKETVSPSRSNLIKILNQIPEKEKQVSKDGRAIRSPYIWLAITQAVTVFSIFFALLPTLSEMYTYKDDPFHTIDKQVATFENQIDEEDASQIVVDYNNNNI